MTTAVLCAVPKTVGYGGPMGFLDKAKDLVSDNRDKIRQGIDAAEQQARKYAPTQHSAKLAKAAEMAHKGVDKIDGDPIESHAAAEGSDNADGHDAGTDTPDGNGGE